VDPLQTALVVRLPTSWLSVGGSACAPLDGPNRPWARGTRQPTAATSVTGRMAIRQPGEGLGLCPVAATVPWVHSPRDCGTIAFEIPIRDTVAVSHYELCVEEMEGLHVAKLKLIRARSAEV
jgi:hypothetical protein